MVAKLSSRRIISEACLATSVPFIPMATLRTAVSIFAASDKAESSENLKDQEEMAIKLIATLPTIVGAIHRVYSGKEIIAPDKNLGYAANFYYMSLGVRPDPMESKIMDTALILHADHGMNASTFSAMVTISTLADMYSSVTSAISIVFFPGWQMAVKKKERHLFIIALFCQSLDIITPVIEHTCLAIHISYFCAGCNDALKSFMYFSVICGILHICSSQTGM